MTAGKYVTRDELIRYYRRKGICADGWPTAEQVADSVIKYAEKLREPEYHEGQVYIDDEGDKWIYQSGVTCDEPGSWLAFGTSFQYRYDLPKRPLHLMIPVDNADLHCPHFHEGL